MTRIFLLLALLLMSACKSAAPVIMSAEMLGASADPTAVARTNLRQTFIQGEVAFKGEIMTTDGIPVLQQEVGAGSMLYVDRDLDVTIKGPVGTPVPASVLVLFPRPGEVERFDIVVSAPD